VAVHVEAYPTHIAAFPVAMCDRMTCVTVQQMYDDRRLTAPPIGRYFRVITR